MSSAAAPLATPATFVGTVWPSRPEAGFATLRAGLLMLVGTGLLALSAKAQVPFPYVPMTMQTLVVLVIGAAYGWRLGAATVALYLVEGLAGLPVFAGPAAGPGYMAGPTGGFLVGFLAAAVVTGYLAERGFDRSPFRIIAMMAIGHAVIFGFGLGWLSLLMPFSKAWAAGVAPFVMATILKTALAAALMQAAWTVARRRTADRAGLSER